MTLHTPWSRASAEFPRSVGVPLIHEPDRPEPKNHVDQQFRIRPPGALAGRLQAKMNMLKSHRLRRTRHGPRHSKIVTTRRHATFSHRTIPKTAKPKSWTWKSPHRQSPLGDDVDLQRKYVPRNGASDGSLYRPRHDSRQTKAVQPQQAVQAQPGADWTRWDLVRALQGLRSKIPSVVARTLRRLRVRLYHAPAQRMKDLLSGAGAPPSVVAVVDDIVDTCSVCREWSKRTPRPIGTSKLETRFNQGVQMDLLFVDDGMVLHLICMCIRWTEAEFIPDKTPATLISTLSRLWLARYGPMQYLESDRESGLVSEETSVYFQRAGIDFRPRPKGSHANVVERHHQMLREAYHKIRSQLRAEGLELPREAILADAVFSKNALISVHGTTPYKALMGEPPQLLRDMEPGPLPGDEDAAGGLLGYSRGKHRLRGIALQEIVAGTSVDRLHRAETTNSRPSGYDERLAVGDVVEFWRDPPGKDLPGWRGPAEISSLKDLPNGVIHVDWQGRTIHCQQRDVRRAVVAMWSLISWLISPARGDYFWQAGPLQVVQRYAATLRGELLQLGVFRTERGEWALTRDTIRPQLYQLFLAILHVAHCDMQLSGVVGARLSRGVQRLPPAPWAYWQAVIFWQVEAASAPFVYYGPLTSSGVPPVSIPQLTLGIQQNLQEPLERDEWRSFCILQLLAMPNHDVERIRNIHTLSHIPHLGGPTTGLAGTWDDQRTSAATAGGSTAPSSPQARGTVHERDEEDQDESLLREHKSICLPELDPSSVPLPDDSDGTMSDLYVRSLSGFVTQQRWCQVKEDSCEYQLPPPIAHELHYGLSGFSEERPELELSCFSSKFLAGYDFGSRPMCSEYRDREHLLVQVEARRSQLCFKAVIQRDTGALTPLELKTHRVEVEKAKLEELQRWHTLGAFRPMQKSEARNLLDCRWVIRWKLVGDKKQVRARLTVRGFKDLQASRLETYSGTASRFGQRWINIQAAQHKMDLWSADVSQAFLQGLSFEEVARETGEPLRSVQIDVPGCSVALLRQLPGLSNFNPFSMCLDMVKPGFGLIDAPRLWGKKFDRVLTRCDDGLQLRATVHDPRIYVAHEWNPGQGIPRTIMSLSTHIDDLKGASAEKHTDILKRRLEKEFGPLKFCIREFEHCGIQHQQLADKSVVTTQDHYCRQLRPLEYEGLRAADEATELDEEKTTQFWSVLGGLAWLSVTRADASVYVGYLQRRATKPTVADVRFMNRLVRYVKSRSSVLTFKAIQTPWAVWALPDSAYRAQDPDALAIRANVIVIGSTENPGGAVQVLDFVSKKLTRIARATFVSELLALWAGTAEGIYLRGFLQEAVYGIKSAVTLRDDLQSGAFHVQLYTCTDNKGVFDAITKEEVQPPTDRAYYMDVKAYRQLLDEKTVRYMFWIDTRDMISDALTKGGLDRKPLLTMWRSGVWNVQHSHVRWPVR